MGGMTVRGKLIFVTGGARSGKSRWAEELIGRLGGRVAYLATCVPRDEEMIARVKIHQQRRPAQWVTVEEPLEVARAVQRVADEVEAILIDCLTLWLTNLLLDAYPELDRADLAQIADLNLEEIENSVLGRVTELVQAAKQSSAQVVMVSNEVGLGIVPGYPLGRLYRDLLGRANQMVAAAADEVYLVVAGIPLEIKHLDARQNG